MEAKDVHDSVFLSSKSWYLAKSHRQSHNLSHSNQAFVIVPPLFVLPGTPFANMD